MTTPDPTQAAWDAEAQLARVQRVIRAMHLLDSLDKEITLSMLKTKQLRRKRREAKWELDRLTINLAVLAPPPAPVNGQAQPVNGQAQPVKARRRKGASDAVGEA